MFNSHAIEQHSLTEQAKKWRKELAKEQRKLERDIAHLGTEEKKSMNEVGLHLVPPMHSPPLPPSINLLCIV